MRYNVFFIFFIFCCASIIRAEELPGRNIPPVQTQVKTEAVLLTDPDFKLGSIEGRDILFKDIQEIYDASIKNIRQKGMTLSPQMHDYLVSGLIDQQVEEFLLCREADKKEIKADQLKFIEIFEKFKSKFKTPENYQKYLNEKKLTEKDIKKKIEDRLKISAFQDFLFKDITVLDDEALKYYKEHEANINYPTSYLLSQIMLYYPQNASQIEKDWVAEKLEGLRKQILAGADFGEVASKNSEGAAANKGGIIGWMNADSQIDPELLKAMISLKKGDISQSIKTSSGVHLLKLMDLRPASNKEFKDVKDEIIQGLLMDKKRETITTLTEEIKKQVKIDIFYPKKEQEP